MSYCSILVKRAKRKKTITKILKQYVYNIPYSMSHFDPLDSTYLKESIIDYMAVISKKHEPTSTAKAFVGLFVLAIVAVLFYKFISNETVFFDDLNALRNYVMFTIVVAGFLIGLMYLSSTVSHNTKPVKSSKTKTSSKKKKK